MLFPAKSAFFDTGLKGKAVRGSALTIFGYGLSQVLRLLSNLVLTRLLFPEAFGYMALVSVLLQGLAMFSDVGIGPSIIRSQRGEEVRFLNTAWTCQVIRGILIWLVACGIAWPVSLAYGGPLLTLIPVASLTVVIAGFNPTKLMTAKRKLLFAQLTIFEIVSQVLGLIATALLAWWWRSIWSLVIGSLVSSMISLLLSHFLVSGKNNWFDWDKTATEELFGFGKWVFLSTVCGFIVAQSDRIVLGLFLTTANLGVYNIGMGLAAVPWTISTILSNRILFPIYVMQPPISSHENRQFLMKFRAGIGIGLIFLSLPLMFFGPWLISQMYDSRYLAAGGIVTLFSIALLPESILLNSDQVLLASGDSKRFLLVRLVSAVLQICFTIAGVFWAGSGGVALGFLLSRLVTFFVLDWAIRKHGACLRKLDFTLLGLSFVVSAIACYLNLTAVMQCFSR